MDLPRLVELRKEKHVSQKVIADLLDISDVAYGRYEKGIAEPNLESLKKLANYFDVTIDYLVGNSDEKKASAVAKKISQLSPKDQNIINVLADSLLEKNK